MLAGTERISYHVESTYASRTNFASEDPNYLTLDAGAANKDNGGSGTAYRLASYFAKVNYSFADQLPALGHAAPRRLVALRQRQPVRYFPGRCRRAGA